MKLLTPLAVASASVTLVGAGNAPASTSCGSITVRLGGNDFSYRVKVVSGRVACDTARRVMRTYIVRAKTPRGWFCARGHGSDAWAASCARIAPRALVRAFLIAG